MSDFRLDFWRILCHNYTMKTKKLLKKEEVKMDLFICAFCVNVVSAEITYLVDGDSYLVCSDCATARLVWCEGDVVFSNFEIPSYLECNCCGELVAVEEMASYSLCESC